MRFDLGNRQTLLVRSDQGVSMRPVIGRGIPGLNGDGETADEAMTAVASDTGSDFYAEQAAATAVQAAGAGKSAVAAGVLNSTTFAAAVAAGAEVFIPAGTWDVPTLTVAGPIKLRGAGRGKTTLRNLTGSVLAISGSQIDVSDMTIQSGPSAGEPTIIQTGNVDQGHWERVALIQGDDDFPIWDNDGHQFIDMRFLKGYSEHTQTATVPSWNLVAAGGLLNSNVWEKWRPKNSGDYHWWVESTSANAQYGLTWRDITFEVCTGGGIRLISVRDYLIDNAQNWDFNSGAGGITTGQQDFIKATRNTDSISCVGTIRRYQRLAGSNTGGVFDINLPTGGGGAGTILERCRNVNGADPVTADLAGNNVLVVASDSPNTSLTNASGAVILANGKLSVAGTELLTGTANPEGSVTANPGTVYYRTSTAVAMYVKVTGTGNTGWRRVPVELDATAPLDFGSIAAAGHAELTITLTGAVTGDVVAWGRPSTLSAAITANCWVSAADTVTVSLYNTSGVAIDPASATWAVKVLR